MRVPKWADAAVSLIVGLIIWQVVGVLKVSISFPPFTDVVKAWIMLFNKGRIQQPLLDSLYELLLGFAIAAVVGVIIGTLMGRYRTARMIFEPYINAAMSSPIVAFVPILILIFGIGRSSMIAISFLMAVFVVIVNTQSGIRNSEANLIEMARSFGATEWQLLTLILIPGALPAVMTGLRAAVGRAVRGVIVGEMLIAVVGTGGLIDEYGQSFNIPYLWALLLTVMLMAVVPMGVVDLADKRLHHWKNG